MAATMVVSSSMTGTIFHLSNAHHVPPLAPDVPETERRRTRRNAFRAIVDQLIGDIGEIKDHRLGAPEQGGALVAAPPPVPVLSVFARQ